MLIFGDYDTMRYDKDWNWIMEVVEKIEQVIPCLFGYYEGAYFIMDGDEYPFVSTLGNSKIESVWLAIIEIIKTKV